MTHGRTRLRDLGITIGTLPTGKYNAITDVAGVWVGHHTLIYDEPRVARTGVTVVAPREGHIGQHQAFAGFHSFNGNGEMTGIHWLNESGLLISPIAITSTHYVGIAHQALVAHSAGHGFANTWSLPVVAETYDGWLNDANAFHLKPEHVFAALASAQTGPVTEGNVGGGTGMVCHEFKGGIGTSSRIMECPSGTYTVGVLVQTNYGNRKLFRVDGVPVGRMIDGQHTPIPSWREPPVSPAPSAAEGPTPSAGEGSIIVIIATDAPLIPTQCTRLAQRATVGLARVGGVGHNGSGDLFLAFATGNDVPQGVTEPYSLRMIPHPQLSVFFDAVAEATEEAILNALTAAETMTGFKGRTVYALPLDELQRVMKEYRKW
jgi:D-aminopeptidase